MSCNESSVLLLSHQTISQLINPVESLF